MKKAEETYRIIISGGGTGGHIYPAIAIAKAWNEKYPESEVLFVGAEGRMEMQKVPEAGYRIEGLKIAGIQRRLTLENLNFPFKLLGSLQKAKKLIKNFKPHLVVGVGGYASGPVLFMAQRKGLPTLIQEQNSYAGLTNKLLAKNANAICVAYPEMGRYFPASKIKYTGNPVRKDILDIADKRTKALAHFGLNPDQPVILSIGGSLGAKTLNQALLHSMEDFETKGYQVLWQTGKYYFEKVKGQVKDSGVKGIYPLEFIKHMDLAYAAADLVISRSGALSVSELSLVGKPVIFIPSPNVAEDHQTKNAMAYVSQNAALLLKDDKAIDQLGSMVHSLLGNQEKRDHLSQAIKTLAKPEAAKDIVKVMEELIQ
ncbi:undecaprenyldiphospho-muramoylpentapeptide beta-N-acetylglucosaminyltransferase [Cyclobacterium marinum]|uniref:UDP-N-acetylglucosamine--N-acetylmuramyl-(pentapeptide) pyrophosphoryl-undecaprenol N-acetylglucosamine transferase n=1 Tax=Cyclobacterium marinum (strain ATCC 25205 / DSM 745 / LMG 13164 / NCIMB 1802) TaxID=880070 RepID=G0IZW8_CYCMS|nr:undecaprenyldiphospho-muramoylpentapeptide beta-N-acetylglucosaminyltransferase [Cyclobacterium marinum]AEL26470.1 UDP-N-acetylglucosamine--N-acetylmuramyl- (pentapeptide) pyrophosphoryl-undecaprenol N-acetylglucosamine transferase [Cyclobacterium marinum DSM 745]